ncbi:MAG: tRNA (guanosine(46)-N7)-methyltransferase TrmB [Bacteroidetes bacterium]|nr:tRNA (guanosine(46)-N7)-methyltransferase TrmB [Bacteroidota bacterium]
MLLDLPNLSFPATNAEIFQRDAPLILEIGFGDGSFLEWVATSHPEWNCLGADVARGSVARAFKRLRRRELSNILLHHGSGLFLLRNLLQDQSLFRAYVNFPDPWKKLRHAERRLFQPFFFELLAARLTQGGSLLLTTDNAPYFEQTVLFARESGYFRIIKTSPPPAALLTKYAYKWQREGRSFYHAEIQKISRHHPKIIPAIYKEERMHHALLSGPIPVITEFEKIIHHFSSGHVVILDAMYMIDQEGLVFVARSHEPELVQELLLQLRPAESKDTDLLLSILNFGKPIATRGTSEAVKAITQWLVQHGLKILDK